MFQNYDAKAIAEVMGLAFVRGSKDGASPALISKTTKGRRLERPSPTTQRDFVIRVDDAPMLMVEIKAKDALIPFGKSNLFSTRLSDFESHRVSSPSQIFIEKAVESGLPRTALRHLAEGIVGGEKAKISSLEWDIVPKTTLERRAWKLSPLESERTERVARLFVHARRALGTGVEAREFMTSSHPELDGRSPIEAAKTDLGTRRAEQILNALEYGLAL